MTVPPGVGLVLMTLRTVRQGHHDADQVTADSSQDRVHRAPGELGESSETARLAEGSASTRTHACSRTDLSCA
ncbi:hypothetical protein SDC9_100082 [bioreactor metagenome]|uniref:Uncharacterized protein n=1 Tax=bioreactor metagenome TaxID=1076179 RepID=A0A645AJB5_9ZZZZ